MGKESHDIISPSPCFLQQNGVVVQMVKLGFNLSHNPTFIKKFDGTRDVALLDFHYHCKVHQ